MLSHLVMFSILEGFYKFCVVCNVWFLLLISFLMCWHTLPHSSRFEALVWPSQISNWDIAPSSRIFRFSRVFYSINMRGGTLNMDFAYTVCLCRWIIQLCFWLAAKLEKISRPKMQRMDLQSCSWVLVVWRSHLGRFFKIIKQMLGSSGWR